MRTGIGIFVLCAFVPVAMGQESATPLDQYLDKVWGQEREVKVIEKRVFEKDHRHEIGFHVGMIPNDPFFNYFPVGLRYDYFVMESLSIELAGAYVPSMDSGVLSDLIKFSGDALDPSSNIPEKLEWYAGIDVYWAPIHGKVALLTSKLTSFDIGLLVGLGVIGTKIWAESQYETRLSYDGTVPFNLMLNVGVSTHWFLTDYLAVRLDYRHYIFPAYPGEGGSEWGNGVRSLAELTIGLGYFTPAPK